MELEFLAVAKRLNGIQYNVENSVYLAGAACYIEETFNRTYTNEEELIRIYNKIKKDSENGKFYHKML